MFVAWTTVANLTDAQRLARGAIEGGLAICVQVEGPVQSIYRWDGKVEAAPEYRLMFKLLPEQSPALREWVHVHHPYTIPEWIVVEAIEVGEKYLSWARTSPTNPPL